MRAARLDLNVSYTPSSSVEGSSELLESDPVSLGSAP